MVMSLDFDSKIFSKDVIQVGDGKESVIKGGRDLFPLVHTVFAGVASIQE